MTHGRHGMRWMICSLGNGTCWNGSFELYLRLDDFLSSLNASLKQIQGFGGDFFDYYLMTEQYAEEVQRTIGDALASCDLDEEMQHHLAALYEVLRGGKIIMG